jgi:HK97 family phage major capsid protein
MQDQTIDGRTPHELKAGLDDLMVAFEGFKAQNDDRLRQIERRGSADVLTTEQIARIEDVLDQRTLKSARPQLSQLSGESGPRSYLSHQHKAAFEGYVRRGDNRSLRDLEEKSLSVSTNSDGGYLVPPETEAAVNRALRNLSPIRAIAGVRQVSGAVFKKPFAVNGIGSGWVGETAVRTQTTTPTLDALTFPTMELYAMPAATQTLLDDSAVNIDQWIADEVHATFAEQEGAAFVTGDGVAQPKGFLSYPTVAQSAWAWGSLGTINTGVAGAFPAVNPADKLVDLVYSVKAGYRANANFVMNRATQSIIRKMKDTTGAYLWAPAGKPGEAPTVLGFSVAESENMPDVAANSLSVAFGDFQRGYLIVDRVGIRVLRDPYSAKPYVLFYTTKRVGGGVQDFDAIKLLKFAA